MGKQELPWVGFEPTTTLQSRQAHTDYAGTKTLYLEPITVLLFYLLTASENHTSLSLSLSQGPYVYELFSIMIHSGSAIGGHYYAYIKSVYTDSP